MDRKCYAGQELIFSTRYYFEFLSSNNAELFQVFQGIQGAGLVERHTKEFYGMFTSVRVQDGCVSYKAKLKSNRKRKPLKPC